jgi:hypothetical protein
MRLDRFEVRPIAGVGELVENGDLEPLTLTQQKADKRRANEARTPSD